MYELFPSGPYDYNFYVDILPYILFITFPAMIISWFCWEMHCDRVHARKRKVRLQVEKEKAFAKTIIFLEDRCQVLSVV